MTFLISIRNLNTTKYFSIDYVIVFIYFNDEKNDKLIKTKIVKKIHLINELKINMLIDNDFIESKKIKIDVINNFVYIDNCEIIIFLNVKTSRKIVHISIHVRKTIIVSSRFEITIIVHYNIISKNRDFLFESKILNFFLYAYLVNNNCKNILVRNDNNKTIQISRNCRVNRLIEIDFFNVFQIFIENNVVELILRKFFTKHKIS